MFRFSSRNGSSGQRLIHKINRHVVVPGPIRIASRTAEVKPVGK